MKQSNYPGSEASRLSGLEFTGEAVWNLMELAGRGKPADIMELQQRIGDYFIFCEQRCFRPGIESLSLALGVSRTAFWQWCKRDDEWGMRCREAKQAIIVFVEQASLTGHLNPACAIFLLKNIANYRDDIGFDDVVGAEKLKSVSADDLPKLSIEEA